MRKNRIKLLVSECLVISSLLAFILIFGCENGRQSPEYFKRCSLPDNAKEVKILGNGWAYFELDDIQYLYNNQRNTIVAVPKK
jgi:hypothetical protein